MSLSVLREPSNLTALCFTFQVSHMSTNRLTFSSGPREENTSQVRDAPPWLKTSLGMSVIIIKKHTNVSTLHVFTSSVFSEMLLMKRFKSAFGGAGLLSPTPVLVDWTCVVHTRVILSSVGHRGAPASRHSTLLQDLYLEVKAFRIATRVQVLMSPRPRRTSASLYRPLLFSPTLFCTFCPLFLETPA